MSENNNMELNDELMENVTGGEGESRVRKEPGTVIAPYNESQNTYRVKRDQGPEAIASYDRVGPLLKPGTRVIIALVGMGKWEIAEFI